jgi:hypothetical protein
MEQGDQKESVFKQSLYYFEVGLESLPIQEYLQLVKDGEIDRGGTGASLETFKRLVEIGKNKAIKTQ